MTPRSTSRKDTVATVFACCDWFVQSCHELGRFKPEGGERHASRGTLMPFHFGQQRNSFRLLRSLAFRTVGAGL